MHLSEKICENQFLFLTTEYVDTNAKYDKRNKT